MVQIILKIPFVARFWHIFRSSEMLKFLFVGGLNTIVGYGSFTVLVLLNVHYAIAATTSHVVAVAHSYVWNKFFTFKNDRKATHIEIAKFAVVYLVVYLVNLSLLWFFIEKNHIHPLVVQAFAVVLIAVISFAGQKFWVFNKKVVQT